MTYTYLALGDSYTIGEQVALYDSFPYQTVQILRTSGLEFYAPEIVAKTGWTTDELLESVNKTRLLHKYDFISLLIGVNNQYRGWPVATFEKEVNVILQKTIELTDRPENVFVLSIPDWGVTPFAAQKNREEIAKDIDLFNETVKNITNACGAHFIDITEAQRRDFETGLFIANDGLHPSANEYKKWSELLAKQISLQLLPSAK